MVTQRRLKEALHYDPETGVFTWRENGAGRRKAVGSIRYHSAQSKDYLRIYICIDGTRYAAHRLAFLYMIGKWPRNVVDHIDRNGLNNKWKNLRDVTHQENCNNRGLQKTNKTGVRGVNFNKNEQCYMARKNVNGKRIFVGYFETIEAAAKAIEAASW